MRRGQPKIVRNEVIEDVTASRIRQYEEMTGKEVKFPVPIERIIEKVLELDFDYDEIEEHHGEQILGALDVENRKILVNTKHEALFQKTPGLERSTIGHEAGHWDMDVDRASLMHPTLPGFEIKTEIVKRHAKKADRFIEVLLRRATTDERAWRLYKQITDSQDSPEVRRPGGPLPVGAAYAQVVDLGGGQAKELRLRSANHVWNRRCIKIS